MKRIVVALILAGVCYCAVIVKDILYGFSDSISTIDLHGGYILKIWNESPGVLGDWDPDDSYPMTYYDVEKDGKVAVHQTYLTVDIPDKYDLKVIFADQGRLAGVYDSKLWSRGLFVMWDAASGESWPRLRENEIRGEPSAIEKWTDRYSRLKRENPTLPNLLPF